MFETGPPLRDISILSFALETWGHVWRNRHQIMSRLARDNRVLFASPPRYVREVFEPYGEQPSEQPGVTWIADGLHAYVPPRWLPVNYRFARLEARLEALRRQHLARTLARLGMQRPILYLWHPNFVDQIGGHDESLVVYHCYDEFRSFDADPGARALLLEREKRLLERADIVFASSEQLAGRRREVNPNTHCVENGVDFGRFAAARDPGTVVPAEIAAIKRPIIGCVATLLDMVDLPMLTQALRSRPDWSFVFVGIERPATADSAPALQAFIGLPNVHFVGRRPIDRIPAYLKGFDVCAIPYVVNGVTEVASSPLKLFEYLAAGKPVVCYPLPLKPELSRMARIAASAEPWVAAVQAALAEGESDARVAERQLVARENTWDQRVAFIADKLAEELRRRASR